jgi:hypothetical protein
MRMLIFAPCYETGPIDRVDRSIGPSPACGQGKAFVDGTAAKDRDVIGERICARDRDVRNNRQAEAAERLFPRAVFKASGL